MINDLKFRQAFSDNKRLQKNYPPDTEKFRSKRLQNYFSSAFQVTGLYPKLLKDFFFDFDFFKHELAYGSTGSLGRQYWRQKA